MVILRIAPFTIIPLITFLRFIRFLSTLLVCGYVPLHSGHLLSQGAFALLSQRFRLRACQALLQPSEPSAADDTTIVISNSSIHHEQVRPTR